MNMVDTKKCFRGVLLWREDVIKCANTKKPLSECVRDLLHEAMGRHELDEEGKKTLVGQIERAKAIRASKRKGSRGRRRHVVLTVDRVPIPVEVRNSAKFVRG